MDTIPPEHYQALGIFVVVFARIEAQLDDGIRRMLGLSSEDGRIITGQLQAGSKLAMAKALLGARFDAEKYETVMQNISDLLPKRNFLVHGVWGVKDRIPVALSLKPKTEKNFVVGHHYPLAKMKEIIEVAEQIRIQVTELFDTLLPVSETL